MSGSALRWTAPITQDPNHVSAKLGSMGSARGEPSLGRVRGRSRQSVAVPSVRFSMSMDRPDRNQVF